ncbi:UvrD-helicase domain-containing protein [Pelomicrobium methylotrophicum]|uniref:DNA 3'-5' helicase n=1 Tax=Pelomicrobium methylotrophicum TaxID=2602750 RepID=A0A5C7ETI2_9PROT|nr:UvrD-helicase domain-containing protein [Pelomicrobium methylotrophicum]TXF10662.1 AAA family ATPase [Pelomicrobium methylotrophicum]
MIEQPVPDLAQRTAALDPERSFIVQAPAGSGKTELLIQRYLRLLSIVDAPEEIAAITFTRKAAGEMRSRVLKALRAGRGPKPLKAHEAFTWQLAQAAVARDAARGWRIEDNPTRLRIQTIDALCASLARQMPVLSRLGAPPAVVEDAGALYREAARATLALLETDAERSPLVARLLAHLDNNTAVAEELIGSMLARRDQWLRHVASGALDRAGLEAALARARLEALGRVRSLAPATLEPALTALARFAAANLAAAGADSPILACADLTAYPPAEEAALPAWLGLAELLLTQEGDWRRSCAEANGFPAPSRAKGKDEKGRLRDAKERMGAVLAALAHHEAFRRALADLRRLPPPRYTDAQWETLEAIARLLPVAVAQLQLVFQSRGEADFTEMAQAALRALGEEDAPTDLALALDYRIRHILVDEFQDTSLSQFELLRRLTAGWEPGDGRTLFAVGDPMQSIYRFREAEVGLFLRARREGIGHLQLTPLRLSTNFRSNAAIVDWVNGAFARVLPEAEDVATGAVPYSPSQAYHPGAQGESATAAVTVHPFFEADRDAEAAQVVALVQAARAEDPAQTVAILVRSRGHLIRIVPALREAGLQFRAIEIEPLTHRPVVQDLFALTRALVHPADRVAWLAVLRAPWCGMTLSDLYALVGDAPQACVWSLLNDPQRWQRLSEDGRRRLHRAQGVLNDAMENCRRGSLRDRVETTWLALGGPACVEDATDLEDADAYLDCLEALERGGDLPDLSRLAEEVAKLFAAPDVHADERLQIMTIHKAKGLEFDTVIVPGLGYKPAKQQRRLMQWMAWPRADGGADLLLAPIKETGAEQDPIYAYIARLDREREMLEAGRLLYVAATRARRRLHLLGHAAFTAKGGAWDVRAPSSATLLARLWPAVAHEYERAASTLTPPDAEPGRRKAEAAPASIDPLTRRLTADWTLPAPPPAVVWRREEAAHTLGEPVEFSWAGESARHVGTVVHRWLQRIGQDALEGWSEARVRELRPRFRAELLRLGVRGDELDSATDRVVTALVQTLADERGRWLLGPHREARCEYRLTGLLDGELVDIAIDRTFVDAQGVRWIVDYKTGVHLGGSVDEFLDREQERYAAQLEKYARLLSLVERAPIRRGLYFPLLKGWREW